MAQRCVPATRAPKPVVSAGANPARHPITAATRLTATANAIAYQEFSATSAATDTVPIRMTTTRAATPNGASRSVAHDLSDPLWIAVAAEAVGGVGQAVEVHTAGQKCQQCDDQHPIIRSVARVRQPEGRGSGQTAEQDAHQGTAVITAPPACRSISVRGSPTGATVSHRQGQPQGVSGVTPCLAEGGHRREDVGSHCDQGRAARAPLASPRRMSSSSSGVSPGGATRLHVRARSTCDRRATNRRHPAPTHRQPVPQRSPRRRRG